MKRIFFLLLALASISFLSAQTPLNSNELSKGITLRDVFVQIESYNPDAPIPREIPKEAKAYNYGPLESKIDARYQYTFYSAFVRPETGAELSLYLGPCDYPYVLSINGIDVFSQGSFKEAYVSSTFKSFTVRIPEALLSTSGGANIIALRIYPEIKDFDYSVPQFIIMSPFAAEKTVFFRNLFRVVFVQAASLAVLVIGLYFLMLALFSTQRRSAHIAFSVICFNFFIAYLEVAMQTTIFSELLLKQLSKIGFCGLLCGFTWFSMEFTGLPKKRKTFQIAITSIFVICVFLFASRNSKVAVDEIFGLVMMLLFVVAIIFISIVLLRSAIKYKNRSSWAVFASLIAIVFASGFDIFSIQGTILPYAYLTVYGFMTMVLTVFMTLALDQAAMYKETQKRGNELHEKTLLQTKIMDEVHKVSDNLTRLGEKLTMAMEFSSMAIDENLRTESLIASQIKARLIDVNDFSQSLKAQAERSGAELPKALEKQTGYVESVAANIANMDSHVKAVSQDAVQSEATSEKLSNIANSSKKVVEESKNASEAIAKYSGFLREIMSSVEDLAERTNTLSINTAIEAARAGSQGKGFSIIAQEIRKLSTQSKDRLQSSFEHLSELGNQVTRSLAISKEVGSSLESILDESKVNADMASRVSKEIELQKKESESVLKAITGLSGETKAIQALFESERKENLRIISGIDNLSTTFSGIEKLLDDQKRLSERLKEATNQVKDAIEDSQTNIDSLTALFQDEWK